MKKLLALLFIASTMLISCEQNGVNEPDNPKDAPLVTFAEGTEVNPTIGYVGGELVFSFISNCSWTVEENDDWINISPTSGNQGNHTLAISVAKNTTGEERLSKITILYGVDSQVVINLTQEANEVFETDSEGNYIVEADGGTVAVKVTTNLEYDVVIDEDAQSWLSVADTRAVREETLTLNVAKNEGSEERSATVNLCAKGGDILQTITIKQNKSNTISCANNEVIYTTKYGYPIELNITEGFGGDLMSHTYENGYGRICFDNDVVSIPNEAFKNCTTLTTIVLPNSLSTINSSAFENCTSLTSITIPDSVTTIGSSALSGCTSLTSVTIPESVTTIGESAFSGCTSLTSVTIPDSVTKIGSYALSGCTSLTSVTIPESVTTIGSSAFAGCTSLTSVTIPDSVTKIGESAFRGCTSLESIVVADGNPVYDSREGCNAIIETTINTLIKGCKTTVIPESVTAIGSSAFRGCTLLTSITIPDSVTKIGSYAFAGCTGELIVNCNIPSATYYVDGAFYGADFTKVTIGDSVTSIGEGAFAGCTSLTRFNGKYASEDNRCLIFDGELVAFASSGLTEYAIPDSVTTIGYSAFYKCTSLESVTIPDSVTSIGGSAFYNCTSLTSITIPDSVTSIGSSTFHDCTSLTSITIPDSVTSIGWYAFYDCTSLTSITIPDSVTSIGDRAFYDCDSLTSVTIGESVTTIEDGAFYGCTSLKEVYCKPTTPPIGGYNMFYGNASGRTIYVPRDSVEAYKSASKWSAYADSIVGYVF